MKFKLFLSSVSVIAVTMVWAFAHEASAQQALDYCGNGCLYTVDGVCVPKRTTYGFHQTHWRRWPFAKDTTGSAHQEQRPGTTAFPSVEVPRDIDEAEVMPELPGVETPDVFDEGSPTQPGQLEIDKQVNPFNDEGGPAVAPQDTPIPKDTPIPMDTQPGVIEELEDFPDLSASRRRKQPRVIKAGYRAEEVQWSRRGPQSVLYGPSANPLRSVQPAVAPPASYGQPSQFATFGQMQVLSHASSPMPGESTSWVDNPLRR